MRTEARTVEGSSGIDNTQAFASKEIRGEGFNKTIKDEGITVNFWIIKVRTSN